MWYKEKPSQCTRCSRQIYLINVAFGKNIFFFFYIFTKKKKFRKKFKFFFNLFLKKKQLYICQSTRLHKQRNKEKRKNIRSKYQKVHSLSSLNFSPDNPFDQGRNTMPRYQDTNLPKKWPAKLELNATNTDIHRRDLVRKQKYFFNGESQFDKKKKLVAQLFEFLYRSRNI